MQETYSSGIAFVFEGDTEKVFYLTLLSYYASKHPEYNLLKQTDEKTGEIYYVLSSEQRNVLVRLNVVRAVSQVANSGAWFHNRCYNDHKSLGWTVFLCYDTDNYNNDISKFYEGDWYLLRKSIEKNRNCQVVDLAAQADIEDIMLLDVDSVFGYLDIPAVPLPTGNKGKSKMKKIFRLKGRGIAYHEGERAKPLIDCLDMEKIISLSTISFNEIEKSCFQ